MGRRLSKKSEKVIKKMMEERLFEHPLALVVKAGARACPELDSGMTLQVALEEEVTAFLNRDFTKGEKMPGDTGMALSPGL